MGSSTRITPLFRRMISLVLLIGMLLAFWPAQPARAETIVNGNIDKNTTWSGVYRVTYPISLNKGVRLVIQPGSVIKFDPGTGIDCYGQMLSLGEISSPVAFTGPSGYWRGLKFLDDDPTYGPSELWGTIIEMGGTQGGSVMIDNATLTIANSEFRDGLGDGVVAYANGNAVITNTLVTGHLGYAYRFNDPTIDPKLKYLRATNNGQNVIALGGGGSLNFGDRLWENAGLPYEIFFTGFTVAPGETLTVEPGVTLRFVPSSTLYVSGRLIAAGTADKPITFTGVQQTPGSWQGINLIGPHDSPATAIISHATIEYGGSGPSGGNLRAEDARVMVEYSTIRHSASFGVFVGAGGVAKIAHSQISDNALGGVKNTRGDIQVSALNNWWGAASGPFHPTTNPGGLGNSVSDNVIYTPWLTNPALAGPAAEQPSALTVDVIGQEIFVPGSRQTYALAYRNGSPATITSAILLAYVPDGASYLRSEGGIYWPGREQVFWKLGNLAPGAEGVVAFSVEYAWGIPLGSFDAVTAAIAGTNAPNDLIAINEYLTYTSPILTRTPLNQTQANQRLAGSPQATALYNQAIAEGFRFVGAFENSRSDGKGFGEVDLFKVGPPMTYQSIYIHTANATAQIFNASGFTLRTGGSQLFFDPQLQNWVDQSALMDASAPNQPASAFSKCMTNCAQEMGKSKIFGKIVVGADTAEAVANCIEAAKDVGNDNAVLGCAKEFGNKIPVVGIGIDIGTELGKCNVDCTADPSSHVCTTDKTECNSGFSAWLYPAKVTRRCNTETGMYFAPEETSCGAPGVGKCVVGADGEAKCNNCYADSPRFSPNQPVKIPEFQIPSSGAVWPEFVPQAPSAAGSQQSFCPACAAAQDPNAKLGLEGMVAPGQRLAYTVQFENMGSGQAFGVFVMDTLSTVFDETSLVLGGGGVYLPGSRTILWDVGELASQGLAGSKGEITYTVKLRTNLTAGTAVINQATVYFPSVPEVTPTNAVVNLVQPIVGKDQQVNTKYNHAVSFQVSGVSAAPGALTYQISQQTVYGTLSGTLPNLTYTPMAGFSGSDTFYFTVSNGIETSLPAQVRINVQASKLFVPMVRR